MDSVRSGEYYTVAGAGTAEIVDRRSRFIGAVSPAAGEEEAQAFLEGIRREHWNARHHVFAYVADGAVSVAVPTTGNPGTAASRCWM